VSPSIDSLSAKARRALGAARSNHTDRRSRLDNHGMEVALRTALGPNDDAIDVGAHMGDITRQIIASAPGGHHLAVEPLPHLARGLRESMPPNVTIAECALSDDEPGEVEFLHVSNNEGYSGLLERDYPQDPEFIKLRVQTRRLDDLVAQHNLRPRLIKIDVEGAELLVLRSGRETIREFRPVILVEHGSAAEGYGESPASFYSLAEELQLRIFDFDGHGPYDRPTFVGAVRPDGFFNFLLRP
jgi:FkbM family methyltransferase